MLGRVNNVKQSGRAGLYLLNSLDFSKSMRIKDQEVLQALYRDFLIPEDL